MGRSFVALGRVVAEEKLTPESFLQDQIRVQVQVHTIGREVAAKVAIGVDQGIGYINIFDAGKLSDERAKAAVALANRVVVMHRPPAIPWFTGRIPTT